MTSGLYLQLSKLPGEQFSKPVNKWILIIVGAALAAVSLFAYQQWQEASNLKDITSRLNTELMQKDLDLGRAHTEIGDARSSLVNMSSRIQKEVEQREALAIMYTELEAVLETEKKNVKIETVIKYKDRNVVKEVAIEVEGPERIIYLTETGETHALESLLFDYKDYRIDINGDAIKKTLSYQIHQRFRLTLIETLTVTGAVNHYAELFEITPSSELDIKLILEEFHVLVNEPNLRSQIFWLAPHVDMTGSTIMRLSLPVGMTCLLEVGVSLSGYGLTPSDLEWRFFRASVGYAEQELFLGISPVQINVAKFIPLVDNIWMTPSLYYLPMTNRSAVGLGIGLVF